MTNNPLRKYHFFNKKGKPKKEESILLKEILKVCKEKKIAQKKIVAKYGLANDESTLAEMLANLKQWEKEPTPGTENGTGAVNNNQETTNPEETKPMWPEPPVESELTEKTETIDETANTMEPGLEETTTTPENGDIPPDPDPYDSPTRKRGYSSQKQTEGEQQFNDDSEMNSQEQGQQTTGNTSDIPEIAPPPISKEPRKTNPDSVRKGAESYVKGYNEITLGLGKLFCKFNERKVKKLERKGEIDLSQKLELRDGNKTTIEDFMYEYNEKVDETLVPNSESDEYIVDALVEVMKKHGHEPSPEQLLMQAVGYDLKEKVEKIAELAATQRDMLDWFMEQHAEKKAEEEKSEPNGKKDDGITQTEVVV